MWGLPNHCGMGILGSDLNSKQDFTEIKSINEVADIFLSFMLQSTLQGYSLFYDDEDVDKKKKIVSSVARVMEQNGPLITW